MDALQYNHCVYIPNAQLLSNDWILIRHELYDSQVIQSSSCAIVCERGLTCEGPTQSGLATLHPCLSAKPLYPYVTLVTIRMLPLQPSNHDPSILPSVAGHITMASMHGGSVCFVAGFWESIYCVCHPFFCSFLFSSCLVLLSFPACPSSVNSESQQGPFFIKLNHRPSVIRNPISPREFPSYTHTHNQPT